MCRTCLKELPIVQLVESRLALVVQLPHCKHTQARTGGRAATDMLAHVWRVVDSVVAHANNTAITLQESIVVAASSHSLMMPNA